MDNNKINECDANIKLDYKYVKKHIKPFDLILFRGADVISNSISFIEKKKLGCGDWSHVGIAITSEYFPCLSIFDKKGKNDNNDNDNIYIYESTMSGILGDGVNKIEGRTFGVQLRRLSEVVPAYLSKNGTRIGWCSLNEYASSRMLHKIKCSCDPCECCKCGDSCKCDPCKCCKCDDEDGLERLKESLDKFYLDNIDTGYDYNILRMMTSVFPFLTKFISDSSKRMFCSELVTHVYKIIGIVDKNIDPETIAPVELISFTNNNLKTVVNLPPIEITNNV